MIDQLIVIQYLFPSYTYLLLSTDPLPPFLFLLMFIIIVVVIVIIIIIIIAGLAIDSYRGRCCNIQTEWCYHTRGYWKPQLISGMYTSYCYYPSLGRTIKIYMLKQNNIPPKPSYYYYPYYYYYYLSGKEWNGKSNERKDSNYYDESRPNIWGDVHVSWIGMSIHI